MTVPKGTPFNPPYSARLHQSQPSTGPKLKPRGRHQIYLVDVLRKGGHIEVLHTLKEVRATVAGRPPKHDHTRVCTLVRYNLQREPLPTNTVQRMYERGFFHGELSQLAALDTVETLKLNLEAVT